MTLTPLEQDIKGFAMVNRAFVNSEKRTKGFKEFFWLYAVAFYASIVMLIIKAMAEAVNYVWLNSDLIENYAETYFITTILFAFILYYAIFYGLKAFRWFFATPEKLWWKSKPGIYDEL